jgi:hypothetical protein
MIKKISQWHNMALLTACISASLVPAAFAAAPVVYELHTTGSVWGYTGTPCNGQACPGWEMLNDDSKAVQIAAGAGTLYQLDSDGTVWQWNGAVCNGNACNRWTQIGADAITIYAAGTNVYFYGCPEYNCGLHQFTGQPCYSPTDCPGWVQLDLEAPNTASYYVQDSYVAEVTVFPDGTDFSIELYLGQPYDWLLIGNLSHTGGVAMAAGLDGLYQLNPNGTILALGDCVSDDCTWTQVGDNSNTTQISASNILYQLQSNNGTVLRYNGTPCNGNVCDGWVQIDANPAVSYIVAGPNTVYELHTNGGIWQYTPAIDCGRCSNWTQLDNNSLTKMVVPGY